MLGHKLWQTLHPLMDTYVTLRKKAATYDRLGLFDDRRVVECVDVRFDADVDRALDVARPDVVLNAVGIIKQLKSAHDPLPSIEINSLLPHRLARACAARGARLVHVSTDCVFSGRRGRYTELDEPDPVDLYGRSKFLGEVAGSHALTVRTSMIGRELASAAGLVEWFLSHRGRQVPGFTRAIYTGFTTLELARVLADLARNYPELHGTWHVSSDPISKFDLLRLLNDRLALSIDVVPEPSFVCDRSLDSSRYRAATGYLPPAWPAMVDELCSDPTPYNTWKQQ